MNELALYFLKVTAATILMYAGYWIFFTRDTYYRRNRILLLSVIILPLLLPIIRISYSPVTDSPGIYVTAIDGIVRSGNNADAALAEGIGGIRSLNLFFLVYFSVTLILLIRYFAGVFSTIRIIKNGRTEKSDFPYVVVSDSQHDAFSFYPYIVMPGKIYGSREGRDILEHEKAHVRQMHSFDLMLGELVGAIQWFNPVIWLIKREIRLNHEYLADLATLEKSADRKEYQYRLINCPDRIRLIPIAHNFSSSIKNRLIMINKKPTPSIARLKNLMIVPMLAVIILSLSFRNGPATLSLAEPQFSEKSKEMILKFLATNIIYPQASKAAFDTSKVLISMKVGKGGIINDCKALTGKGPNSIEALPEIVIVGYTPKPEEVKAAGNVRYDHRVLVDQCLKLANRLNEAAIPEFKNKDTEFILTLKFVLK